MFVADDAGDIKGMVSVQDNEITKLYIDPHCQRKGIGKRLFAHAEAFLLSRGHQDMFLGAAADTPVPFYESMGMRITRTETISCGPCSGMKLVVLDKRLGPNIGLSRRAQ